MYNITFISTVHIETGKCNADELYKIIKKINPQVIFLEALQETYSEYDKLLFSSFGVYHTRLEISAIQKYSFNASFEYIPTLDNGLSDAFNKKYNIVCENIELQKLIDNFNFLAINYGFQFLNSVESIRLHEEMRMLENSLLNDDKINKMVSEDIEEYENSMLRNIYSYCKKNQFDTAIFMCGSAHRKSIIEKIGKFNVLEEISLKWKIFEN